MTASNTTFTVFSGIGFIISLIPLSWHLEAQNAGTCLYLIWTALACLAYFINSIVWSGNVTNWAPVWCDITVRIQVGVAVAWPACILLITRRLYYIVSATVGTTRSRSERRREMIVGLSIGIGIPVLEMLVELVASGHRFNIIEDFGCAPATYNTPLAYVLVWSWPLIISVVSAGYGVLAIRAFMGRRQEFGDLIAANTNLTYSCYRRLVALAAVDFCFTIPMALWAIIANGAMLKVYPWISWADTHRGYSKIRQFPRILAPPATIYSFETTRWSAVLCAFVFFGFFGFADEARKNYRLWMRSLKFASPFSTPRQTPTVPDASKSVSPDSPPSRV